MLARNDRGTYAYSYMYKSDEVLVFTFTFEILITVLKVVEGDGLFIKTDGEN